MTTQTWTDLDIELTPKNNGDVSVFEYTNAIKSSMKNIMATMQGSRRMLPEFARGVHRLLFEPMDEITANLIGEAVLDTLGKWEPRIIVRGILVVPYFEKGYYEVRITFQLKNLSRSEETEELTQIFIKR